MRLLRLKIRNIASLKGEHEVDFLEIQKESPLFAITGETGSGKSLLAKPVPENHPS
jgi:DNA repair protein SbcC/Rad50